MRFLADFSPSLRDGAIERETSSMHERPNQSTIAASTKWQNTFAVIALFLLAGIGVARIIPTYQVFSQTSDEPAHIATGLEWLQRGTYTLEPLHPPLARVAVALGPYQSGLRLAGQDDVWHEGNGILLANGQYLHNLTLARLGTLPFFLIATLLVWYWARVRYGNGPACVATLLFTTSPIVLAHAGLATTDMAITAGFTIALITYINWLERPTYLRATTFGIALGFATLCKFSALVFLPACGLALLIWRFLRREKKEDHLAVGRFQWLGGLALAALTMCLVVWAGYRFSIGSLTSAADRPHAKLDRVLGSRGTLHKVAYAAVELPWVPAPAFFQGLDRVRKKEARGHTGYLLGQVRERGWWYFFPVALAVKTTLPFLALLGMGVFYLGGSAWIERDWIRAAPIVAALALLLVCMPSQINIGVRHILPIFPLFAVIAGAGACWFWNSAKLWSTPKLKYGRFAVILLLLAWHLTSSIRAHPDYLAYFNELAGQHPEKILIDSDLDWGQDLFRLSSLLREKRVPEVSVAYAGSQGLDLSQFGLPPFRVLAPRQPTDGWIAISLLRLKAGGLGLPKDAFSWLEAYQPVGVAGRSIWLFYVPPSPRRVAEPPVSHSQARSGQ
jgi:dolichyl-phosphate-mannose-protein mannosyltransferase